MFKSIKTSFVLLCIAVLFMSFLAACGQQRGSSSGAETTPPKSIELTISAAASLTDALQELQPAFEAANPGIKLNFNFGGSGALQQQIEQGAPADLFLSAAMKNMQALVDKELIDTGRQVNLLTNALVVVAPEDSQTSLTNTADLTRTEIGKIAIGVPETVPAGSYAKEALTNAALWETLQPKLVQAKDVRQVLQYVETGNVDAGFVYMTDALTSEKVRVAFAVDPASYTPVVYPVGIVKATKHQQETVKLFEYLQTEAAMDIFEKYGFAAAQN